jgi:hypothetical protein
VNSSIRPPVSAFPARVAAIRRVRPASSATLPAVAASRAAVSSGQ